MQTMCKTLEREVKVIARRMEKAGSIRNSTENLSFRKIFDVMVDRTSIKKEQMKLESAKFSCAVSHYTLFARFLLE